MRQATALLLSTALLLVSTQSFAGKKKPAETPPTTTTTSPAADAAAAADAAWAKRFDEASLQDALKQYEAIVTADPTNRKALERLTRGWYFWGDSFTLDTAVKIERWGKAIEWGKKCLGTNAEIASRTASGAKDKDAIEAATKDDVPCIYWTASALGKWGKAQGLAKTLKYLPTVKAYITKADTLDPTFFNYGPARYWGAYYAIIPSFAGQDFEKSAQFFATSAQGAPYYLGTYVLRAENLAVQKADIKLFDSDLQFVLTYDVTSHPEVEPENRKEQEKAKALQAKRAELFDEKALAGGSQ